MSKISIIRSFSIAVTFSLAIPLTGCLALDGKAERHLVTTVPVPTTLEVESTFLDVDVTLATTNEVGIKADVVLETSGGNATAEREIEHVMVSVVRDGDRLIIRQGDPAKPWRFSGSSSGSGRIAITVPANVQLTFQTASGDVRLAGDFGPVACKLATASGDMTLTDLGVSTLAVGTASGDGRIAVLRSLDRFSWRAASGDLQFTGGAETVSAASASGNVVIDGIGGAATVGTASGDVRLGVIAGPALGASTPIKIATASGDVSVTLPASAQPIGTITTVSGRISADQPVQSVARPGSNVATFSGNGVPLNIETASGDIAIKQAK
ncbi:MAG: DUF4097 family beta strand repeat-containing protein [Phycisphaerae bacterium]|nr:DUF4097 family beta strand repeat-containing protein [Phycisphaerae bacterium]